MRRLPPTLLLTIVLAVSLAASAQTETVLYNFCNGVIGCTTDGLGPVGSLIIDPAGNFYGVTNWGGTYAHGTVFKLTPDGTESILYSFGAPSSDGLVPDAGLLRDGLGNLYGTTAAGGTYSWGTVFKLAPDGTETILHSFSRNGIDGASPESPLLMDKSGNLYGTTIAGGPYNDSGILFELSPDGTETILHSFGNGTDGAGPSGALIMDSAGNLYGTTQIGGAYPNGGTVFKYSSNGTETILHNFNPSNGDGVWPFDGVLMDKKGNLYGTTAYGGVYSHGTLFVVRPDGSEVIVHRFGYKTDGSNPEAGLIMDAKGNLYGTTFAGGSANRYAGTVFRYSPAGTETILVNFDVANGYEPVAGLIMDKSGNLYGVTTGGGTASAGTVFKVTP